MFEIEGSQDRESTVNMLCCPQHKDQNYFQAEGTKLLRKGIPSEFDFIFFQTKYENSDQNFNCVNLR